MAFGIGINAQEANAGEFTGQRKEIACHCWFTQKGGTIPLMIKFEDEDGMIHTVKEIEVLYQEKKNYAGISAIEYSCIMTYGGLRLNVKLMFFQEECKWVMVV